MIMCGGNGGHAWGPPLTGALRPRGRGPLPFHGWGVQFRVGLCLSASVPHILSPSVPHAIQGEVDELGIKTRAARSSGCLAPPPEVSFLRDGANLLS